MKIFKNRGDIYISKSDYKSSKEERVLLSLLAIFVAFTIVFLIIVGNKYHYSIKEFFASDKIIEMEKEQETVTELVPVISGKTNYLIIETNDSKDTIFYMSLIQADGDNLAYKVTTLSPYTIIDGQYANDIFKNQGLKKLNEAMSNYLGFKIDYFVGFTHSNFKEFVGNLGTFLYPSSETFKFSGGSGNDEYSVRLNEGEQKINSKIFSDTLRYYVNEKKNYAIPNEITLYGLVGLVNQDNNEKSEKLFKKFIANSTTNITVRDYANSTQKVEIFSSSTENIKVYSCVAGYDKEYNLTQAALSDIRNYFGK